MSPHRSAGGRARRNPQFAESRIECGRGARSCVVALVGLFLTMNPLPAAELPASESAGKDPVIVDPKTEAVVKGALKWLASKQAPNGAWGASEEEQRHPIAITGYVLMAFQAAGHLPGEGEFGKNVAAGMQYLLDSTAADGIMGNRNNGQYMYGHGVAAIALAELYGQTRSPTMRQ